MDARLLAGSLCACLLAAGAQAATLVVRHSPGAGEYATVTAALAVATSGDVIEIRDNSAPYVENVAVDGSVLAKNNLTIRGQDGLVPLPVIQGDPAGPVNPFDPGIGRVTLTYNNSVDNLVVENVRLEAPAGVNVVVDARFWNGATFNDCEMIATGGLNAFRSQVNSTLNGCTLSGPSNVVIDHFFGGPLNLNDCTVDGGSIFGLQAHGGTMNIDGSYLSSNSGLTFQVFNEFAGNPVTINLTDTIVAHSGAVNGNILNVAGGGSDAVSISIDNCDFIGGGGNTSNGNTGAGILLNRNVAALSVTDTIFFNITSVAYALFGNTAGLTGGIEDHCFYKFAPNNLSDQGVTEGVNSIENNGALLYVDPANGDFRLEAASPAATLNSTGTPAYAGSQGVAPPPPPTILYVDKTPEAGEFATIAAALAAAQDGNIIEIQDNSAPFVEQVVVDGINNLTIRGTEGLSFKPVIRGTGASNPYDGGIQCTMTYNNADGLRVENLRIESSPSDTVTVDARFWNGARFENVEIIGRAGGFNAVRSQVSTTFVDCLVQGANTTVDHFFGGPLVLDNCVVKGGASTTVKLHGGSMTVRNNSEIWCDSGAGAIITGIFAGNPTTFSATDTIFYGNAAFGHNLVIITSEGAGEAINLAFQSCDFIGGRGDVNFPTTGAGIILNRAVDSYTVRDSIFFNIVSVAYLFNGFTSNLQGFEDWNAYNNSPNNQVDQGVALGQNSIEGESCYVDPVNGDFSVFNNISVATRSSPSGPGYMGSVGPSAVADPNAFERDDTVLLTGFHNMYNPMVIRDSAIDPAYPWRMWFFGWAVDDCNTGFAGCDAIYHARSADLVNWEVWKGGGQWDTTGDASTWVPVVTAGNQYFDEWHVGDPSVVKRNGTYYMAFSSVGFDLDRIPNGSGGDTDGDISVVMMATSTDGITWTKSAAPILIYAPEIGQLEVYSDPSYTGNYHRPSLMYDVDTWKIWFDTWESGPGGLSMGYATCPGTSDPMDPANWTVINDGNNPMINEWPNPSVVKFDGMYYSVADPSGYLIQGGWPSRQTQEATSPDGINWTKRPYFHDPDAGFATNHVPEATILSVDGSFYLYVFYANQLWVDPFDFRYKQIRAMRRFLAPDPASVESWEMMAY